MSSEFSGYNVILIVDDNSANLAVLSDVLDSKEMEVLVAQDGESAIQKASYEPPDLILLDVMMPGIDGFETCRQLKANPSTQNIPVIFMTALSDTVDKVKGFHLGAVDYITKPFEQEEVLMRVKHHLQVTNLTKQLQTQNHLLNQLTQELEQRVEDRTAKLSQALCKLQQSQVSLVQKEKMAALGELVAGVAHEINNPLSCIAGNLDHADDYVQDLIELIRLYQQHYPHPIPAIQNLIENIDLEYLVEDLPQMISSMQNSSDRIEQIVYSLRHFSRRDETAAQSVNIHEGIDSTLLILQHRLKATSDRPEIQVVKEYGELPAIVCYPGPMNQVFMNILANAIDAIDEATKTPATAGRQPTIWIRTIVSEQRFALIQIADNGIGMTAEVKQRLSDPMFTTKPVDKGTGLGLSISRQIIEEKHGGCLKCMSEPGNGAEFWIQLPFQPKAQGTTTDNAALLVSI